MLAGVPTRGRAAFWALCAATAATRLAIVFADHRSLIATDIYPDDAFYYLRIAANLVAGRGWTFDGLAPTNGFHPLYLLMVAPIVALSGDDLVLPIHLSGVLLTAWAVGAGVVLYALLRRVAGWMTATFGLLLWAVCPYFIVMSVNGLETVVAVFFVLLVAHLYLSWLESDARPDPKRILAFGAVCGLGILARVDVILLLAAVLLHWLARSRRQPGRAASVAGLAAAGAMVVWLPWGLVSHHATGHWLPTSGAASRQIALSFGWLNMAPIWPQLSEAARQFDPAHVPAAYHADVATKLGFVYLLESPLLAPIRANVPAGPWADLDRYLPYSLFCLKPPLAAALLLAGAIAALVVRRRARGRTHAAATAGDPTRAALRNLCGVYLLLVAAGYTFYSPAHWYFNRYLVGPIALSTAWGLVEARRFFSARPERRPAAAIAALAVVACQLVQWQFFTNVRWSAVPPAGFLASWQGVGAKVDPQARLGAFQAGIYGYFGRRDVVNLDGKVNQDAFAAIGDKRLHDYIHAQNVRYILDRDWILDSLCARHAPAGAFSARPVAIGTKTGGVQLFEVLR
jgi:hypothetical protein